MFIPQQYCLSLYHQVYQYSLAVSAIIMTLMEDRIDGSSMTLAEELSWRGFIHQTTFREIAEINEPRTFYWGVDPSSDSMTIGNLAAAMMIRHFINYGHTPLLLVGGATGMIGDPDGKKQERALLSSEEIENNKRGLAKQYAQIFAGHEFEIVDNYDWFKNIDYLDFLRTVGKHVSMTQLLDREFIQSRIGEGGDGISYAEFSYSLIQGYDFLHLYNEKKASLQLSGADQWGNCITGVQLIRKLEAGEAHVVTMPLIVNKSTGRKFGKSEDGAVWLDPLKTSPYKFYQFWLNVDDETAEGLVKIYTLLDKPTIDALVENHHINPSTRALQKTLAREVTDLVHGVDRRGRVERVTEVLFGTLNVSVLSEQELDELTNELPSASIGVTVIDALVSTKITQSAGEARRLIEAGAVSLNGVKVINIDQSISTTSLLKKGKNNFVLVR